MFTVEVYEDDAGGCGDPECCGYNRSGWRWRVYQDDRPCEWSELFVSEDECRAQSERAIARWQRVEDILSGQPGNEAFDWDRFGEEFTDHPTEQSPIMSVFSDRLNTLLVWTSGGIWVVRDEGG